jgi:hypothetical protein
MTTQDMGGTLHNLVNCTQRAVNSESNKTGIHLLHTNMTINSTEEYTITAIMLPNSCAV